MHYVEWGADLHGGGGGFCPPPPKKKQLTVPCTIPQHIDNLLAEFACEATAKSMYRLN